MSTPHKCPICLGTGNVPGGFYQCVPGGTPISSSVSEKCRSCVNGVIYDYSPNYTIQTSTGGGQNFEFQKIDPEFDNKVAYFKAVEEIKELLGKIYSCLKSRPRKV